MRVIVSNAGGNAFVVQPYLVVDILNSDLDGSGILLEPRVFAADENPFRLTEGGFSIDIDPSTQGGAEVMVDAFLPDGQASAYTIVALGSSEVIDLVRLRVLASDAEKSMGLMEGETLPVVLTAMSVEGKRITSAKFVLEPRFEIV
ncbi:hypothetical protein [Cognatiyoonia sp. IB215182]|uniref:hypothetical protein n=1 Tax=Cognatiyoonia sp. IB215182 TaxID=3097353 RepID=UPI002A0E70E7|nr:hypothetical protein [Cognatiyoonia sp. IB215182]MDX8353244.1 hypothetical protein [Cognatiyoonia sp. IB215182]